jgi:septum formation protein
LILASGSPRRKHLLNEAGLLFEVIESGVIEDKREEETAPDFVLRMATAKALAVSAKARGAMVLGADTIVEIDGDILGKPGNPEHAREMLQRLSGRTHNVITAFAIAKDRRILESQSAITQVRFRQLSEREITEYVAGSEPYDKAGGYAAQGTGAAFIAHIEGSYTNVMGLPLKESLAALRRHRVMW